MNALDICKANASTPTPPARVVSPIADPAPDFRNFEVEHKRTVMLFVKASPEQFRKDFYDWLNTNFHVWQAFEREANRIWDYGRRHYSARTIIEVLRHESALRDSQDVEWKLNDNKTPDLACLYICVHPDRYGFFETRSGNSAVRAR